jgi:two-component system response regulator YesN
LWDEQTIEETMIFTEAKGMYSLLIVDDEKWVRHGLRFSVDWQSEEIEVLGDAEDGEQALKMIEERTPDIIITDIRMPGMDGIALMEMIKARKLHTKVIIISGYGDFSYALKALKNGASDYILKPIEENNLLTTVRICVEQLRNEYENDHQMKKMSCCIRESLPLARQHYLEKVFTGYKTPLTNRTEMWDALKIDLNPERLSVICIQIYGWKQAAIEPKDQALIRYALSNIAEEIGLKTGKTVACPMDTTDSVDVAVMYSPLSGNPNAHHVDLVRSLDGLIATAEQYLGIRINIGISRERGAASLPESFQEANDASAYAFYSSYGKVYDAANLPNSSHHLQLQPRIYKGPDGWAARLTHVLKIGQETPLQELVDELVRHIMDSTEMYPPHVMRRGLTNVLYEAEQKTRSSHPPVSVTSDTLPPMRLIVPCCPLAELGNELMTMLRQFRQQYGNVGSRKRVIELAIKYTESHYTEGITMNSVAEHLFLNPSYFSKIFHEDMDETFSKYLIKLRMQKAKRLLKESTLKIYEIAHQIGYNDFRHFAKMFKEQEGMTPAQYRDLGI